MKIYATVTLMGRDRTGAIAQVTQTLFRLKANIESLQEEVARGQFRMTLQASWSGTQFADKLIRNELQGIANALGMDLHFHVSRPNQKRRMAILVTKEEHAARALLESCKNGRLKAEPVVMLSNHRVLKPLADAFDLPFHAIPYSDRERAEGRLMRFCDRYHADFLVLARFMKILSPDFVWRWKNRIINIHPSLLPAFPGASAYRQAYEKGVKVIGVTAHFATPDLDQGPIISQACFTLKGRETLAEIVRRGRDLESRCLRDAVRKFLSQQLDVYWGKVHEH